jgi:hypothetical protein
MIKSGFDTSQIHQLLNTVGEIQELARDVEDIIHKRYSLGIMSQLSIHESNAIRTLNNKIMEICSTTLPG